ncbi:MAG: pentapeptide repeat-containing protein, partial [Candidatus Thermoplasmatota archaeon]|nr:pentapeptide repeat-containing protein [Candidatus Thermoplasmatota archaeon]
MKDSPFEPVGEKKYAGLEVKKSKKGHIAIGMVMLLIFVSMMAYMISTVEENNMATNEEMVTELGNWDTYYVESADGLPVCNEDTNGRLYYVESSESFEACTSTGWTTVEIKGEDGVDGVNGLDGQAGMDGQDVDETYLQNLENELLNLQLAIADLENQNSELNDTLVNATSCQLVPYAYCAGANLSYMNLSRMDLTGIDLRGANLLNTTFDYATLDGADLRSIFASNATFIGTGMNRTFLQFAEFNRYSYDCSDGWGLADYCGPANLTDAYLSSADLTNANLEDADLTNANLFDAILANANLVHADLTDAYLWSADLTDADLEDADLTDAYLSSADL